MTNELSEQKKLSINDLPIELLGLIFSKLEGYHLCKSVILTCKKWKDIVDSESFWTEKLIRDYKVPNDFIRYLIKHDSYDPKKLWFKNPYNKNLIKNPCGDKGYFGWDLKECVPFSNRSARGNYNYFEDDHGESDDDDSENESNMKANLYEIYKNNIQNLNGSNGFLIQDDEVSNLKEDSKSPSNTNRNKFKNYATTYYMCTKYQMIDLYKEAPSCLIKNLKPKIKIEDHYRPKDDCGSKYFIEVVLFDENFQRLDSVNFNKEFEQWTVNPKWNIFDHTFENYPSTTRYVLFQHGGKDTQFWAGHYGIKLTNSSVKLIFF